jgi:hypothetical protein
MQLFQLVLRCVTGPFKAAVHRPAYHHVVHHIGHLGRLPIRRIAAYPLCQRSCRLNRIGTFGGAESRKWLDTDKRIKNG